MRIDDAGFRLNVGIVLRNQNGKLFWGQRVQQDAWQFPQGGLKENESPLDGMYRELHEEVGLNPGDVKVVTETKNWHSYSLPKQFIRNHSLPKVLGQKQKWFLLELTANEESINLEIEERPEFSDWIWVEYWHPVKNVIFFKKQVYQNVLEEFDQFIKE